MISVDNTKFQKGLHNILNEEFNEANIKKLYNDLYLQNKEVSNLILQELKEQTTINNSDKEELENLYEFLQKCSENNFELVYESVKIKDVLDKDFSTLIFNNALKQFSKTVLKYVLCEGEKLVLDDNTLLIDLNTGDRFVCTNTY